MLREAEIDRLDVRDGEAALAQRVVDQERFAVAGGRDRDLEAFEVPSDFTLPLSIRSLRTISAWKP